MRLFFPVALLVLLLACPRSSHSFTTSATTTRRRVPVPPLFSANNSEEAPNLYHILGASPKDSDAELKRKWKKLARRLHPDVKIQQTDQEGQGIVQQGQDTAKADSYPYELSDVNAAWGVLSDPKERRRYDRALQAQELADTFEILLDAGIKTAIPFFKKTADGAVKLGEETGKTWLDVNKKMRVNAKVFDLEAEAREWEKKATNAQARIQRLQKQLQNQDTKQLQTLRTPNAPLSSQDAIRLLDRFSVPVQGQPNQTQSPNKSSYLPQSQSILARGGASTPFGDPTLEIEYLQDLEYQYQDQSRFHLASLNKLKAAQKLAADAILAEERAIQRLEQAQRDLAEAQARNHACQKAQFEAVQLEKEALLDANAIANQLDQQTEKVRYVLKQKENQSLAFEARKIQQEIAQLEIDQLDFEQQAQKLKDEAQQLRRRASD